MLLPRDLIRQFSALFLLLQVALLPLSAAADEVAEVAEARRYVEQLDAGAYLAAWEELDVHARRLDDQARWLQRQAAIRSVYGALLQRACRLVARRGSYALHPDGAYIVINFESVFSAKAAATETVVLRQEPDGTLVVVAYVCN